MSEKKTMLRWVWWVAGTAVLLVVLAFGVAPSVAGRMMNRTETGTLAPLSNRAIQLHSTLDVVDLHSDALLWRRDLNSRGSWGHVDIPRLIEGRVAVQAFTVVTKTPRGMNIEANAGNSDNITLLSVLEGWPSRTRSSLKERALYQAQKLSDAAANSGGRLAIIRTREDLRSFLDLHHDEPETVAGFLGVEGLHALEGDLANVDVLYDAGFRMFGLTHFFDNEVGGSAHGVDKGGLTDFGFQVVRRADELGIILDLAHASPALINTTLTATTRPVFVSHTGVKGTCDNQRNLSDEQLAALGAHGALIGIGFWETAVCGNSPADWARAVRHAANIVSVGQVALGSDWDGAVTEMIDASQTAHLTQALLNEGFSDDEIRMIMGGNAIRFLEAYLPAEKP